MIGSDRGWGEQSCHDIRSALAGRHWALAQPSCERRVRATCVGGFREPTIVMSMMVSTSQPAPRPGGALRSADGCSWRCWVGGSSSSSVCQGESLWVDYHHGVPRNTSAYVYVSLFLDVTLSAKQSGPTCTVLRSTTLCICRYMHTHDVLLAHMDAHRERERGWWQACAALTWRSLGSCVWGGVAV